MNCIKRNFPNAITCVNVLAGTAAIMAMLHSDASLWGLGALQGAWILVGVAAVADFLDGFAARALGAYSALGKELDSLCDLVSFGVAPAVMVHQCVLTYGGEAWVAWVAPLIAVAGALRLARFNTAPENNRVFTGLPIPANAIFWIGFTAWYSDLGMMPGWITLGAIVIVSWLMISPLRLFTLKFTSRKAAANWPKGAIAVLAVVLCACLGVAGLMWTVICYLCLSAAMQPKLRD